MDKQKNSEERDQKNSNDAPPNERRFWETYFAVIQQRMKTEKDRKHENHE